LSSQKEIEKCTNKIKTLQSELADLNKKLQESREFGVKAKQRFDSCRQKLQQLSSEKEQLEDAIAAQPVPRNRLALENEVRRYTSK